MMATRIHTQKHDQFADTLDKVNAIWKYTNCTKNTANFCPPIRIMKNLIQKDLFCANFIKILRDFVVFTTDILKSVKQCSSF